MNTNPKLTVIELLNSLLKPGAREPFIKIEAEPKDETRAIMESSCR